MAAVMVAQYLCADDNILIPEAEWKKGGSLTVERDGKKYYFHNDFCQKRWESPQRLRPRAKAHEGGERASGRDLSPQQKFEFLFQTRR